MKKLVSLCFFALITFKSKSQCPWSFTITNNTGSYTLTCTNPTINLSATNNNTNAVNYLWTGPTFTSNVATASVTLPGNYSVAATDAVTSCSLLQTFSISQNTLVPTNSVNPISFSITCISNSMSYTGTAISPTLNIQNDWYSPLNPFPGGFPIITGTNAISIYNGIGVPGVYQFVTTNLNNGCSSVINVTISSITAFPNFSVTSSSNFLLGCATNTLSFTNVVSTQTPPATVSFTFLAPTFTGSVPQGVPLSPNPSMVVNALGTWTMIAQDNSNFCRTEINVPILQATNNASFTHTVAPAGVVNFESTSTGTTGGTTYGWDFGDGTTGTGITTSHTYSNGGVHQVVLNTFSPSCNTNNIPVNVNTIPCIANSNFTMIYSGIPQNWVAIPAYYGNVTNAVWNWGDGSSTNALFPTHTYSAAGLYNICLTVTVSCANSSSTCAGYNIFKTIDLTQAMITVSVLSAYTPPPIGIKENSIDNSSFLIYPNPTNSDIHIYNLEQKSGTVKVFSLEGKEIQNLNLEANQETKIENLNEGIYFVEINVDESTIRKKVVVIK